MGLVEGVGVEGSEVVRDCVCMDVRVFVKGILRLKTISCGARELALLVSMVPIFNHMVLWLLRYSLKTSPELRPLAVKNHRPPS